MPGARRRAQHSRAAGGVRCSARSRARRPDLGPGTPALGALARRDPQSCAFRRRAGVGNASLVAPGRRGAAACGRARRGEGATSSARSKYSRSLRRPPPGRVGGASLPLVLRGHGGQTYEEASPGRESGRYESERGPGGRPQGGVPVRVRGCQTRRPPTTERDATLRVSEGAGIEGREVEVVTPPL